MTKLRYTYDLLYDIKTEDELQAEVEYLAHRLAGLSSLCREDNKPIDDYVLSMLNIPKDKAK